MPASCSAARAAHQAACSKGRRRAAAGGRRVSGSRLAAIKSSASTTAVQISCSRAPSCTAAAARPRNSPAGDGRPRRPMQKSLISGNSKWVCPVRPRAPALELRELSRAAL